MAKRQYFLKMINKLHFDEINIDELAKNNNTNKIEIIQMLIICINEYLDNRKNFDFSLVKLILILKQCLKQTNISKRDIELYNTFKRNTLFLISKNQSSNNIIVEWSKQELDDIFNISNKMDEIIYKNFYKLLKEENLDSILQMLKFYPNVLEYKNFLKHLIEKTYEEIIKKESIEKKTFYIELLASIQENFPEIIANYHCDFPTYIHKKNKTNDREERILLDNFINILKGNYKAHKKSNKFFSSNNSNINTFINIILNHKTDIISNAKAISLDKSSHIHNRDDAFSIQEDGENTILGIHVTDVGGLIGMNNPQLNKKLKNIYKTNYINGQKINLFPTDFSTSNLSLDQYRERRCVSVYIIFNNNGVLEDIIIKNDMVYIAKNLSFGDVYNVINDKKNIIEKVYKKDIEKLLEILPYVSEPLDIKNIINLNYSDTNIGNEVTRALMLIYNTVLPEHMANKKDLPFIYKTVRNTRKTNETHTFFTIEKENHPDTQKLYSSSSNPIRMYPAIVNQIILNELLFSNPTLNTLNYWRERIELMAKFFNDKETNLRQKSTISRSKYIKK